MRRDTGRIVVEVESTTTALRGMRAVVGWFLADRLGRDILALVLVAISEAVTNAIEAHDRAGVTHPVDLTIDRGGGTVTVIDRSRSTGNTFASDHFTDGDVTDGDVTDGDQAERPAASRSELSEEPGSDTLRLRGRGMLIMRSICPGLRVVDGTIGRTVVLPFPDGLAI